MGTSTAQSQIERMRKPISQITIFIFITVLLVSCARNFETQMTMITMDNVDSLRIGLSGSYGTATIDWGEKPLTKSGGIGLGSLPVYFTRTYSDKDTRTIAIYGSHDNSIEGVYCSSNQLTSLFLNNNPKLKNLVVNKNNLTHIDLSENLELIELNCSHNQLTNLDVSRNTALQRLSCEINQLKSLDLSKNNNLRLVYLRSNELSAAEINSLFKSLHNNKTSKTQLICIGGNPGTDSCDKSIATNKGWKVITDF